MKYLISFFLLLTLFNCQTPKEKKVSKIPFLPIEASIIIRGNDFEKASSLLQNNALLQQNKSNKLYTFFKNLNELKVLSPNKNEFFICFSPLGKNDFGISVITPISNTEVSWQSLQKYFIENRAYNGIDFKALNFNEKPVFATQLQNQWVVTSDALIMENHIKQAQNKITFPFPEAIESLDNKAFSLIVNNSEIRDAKTRLLPNLPETHFLNEKFSGWTAGDLNLTKNAFDFNGIYKAEKNKKHVFQIVNTIEYGNNEMAAVVPENFNQFTSITYTNYENLKQSINQYEGLPIPTDTITSFLNETSEFGNISLKDHRLFVLKLGSEEALVSDYIETKETQENYRNFPIYELNKELDFNSYFKPFFNASKVHFYIQFKEFAVFSETKEGLLEIIPSLKNNQLLGEKKWFQKFTTQLSKQSAILQVSNIENTFKKTATYVNSDFKKSWANAASKNFEIAALQLIPETTFSHLHMVSSKINKSRTDFTVTETDNVILKNNLKNRPQFVKNHLTNTYDIIAQDSENQLILISNEGDILWKIPVNEPIIGEIQQMDMYRNRRLQLVFTTPTKLYVLDRNGKNVSPFPLSFDTNITQPVAVFDYDNNRKYRILITQKDQLTMFDRKGKQVKGFNFKNKSNGTITHTPKHIRVGKKDFIVVNESNTGVHFLNRTGKERIKLKDNTIESTNEWYWYKNAFSSLGTDQKITQVNLNGEVFKIPPPLKIPNAKTDATAKTWVAFAENSLSIKDKLIELDYGNYSSPQIFYVNDKIYVSITNLDNKQVMLYDSNAKAIKGFPVYGSGEASVLNADKDRNLELIVKGDHNSILMYEFK